MPQSDGSKIKRALIGGACLLPLVAVCLWDPLPAEFWLSESALAVGALVGLGVYLFSLSPTELWTELGAMAALAAAGLVWDTLPSGRLHWPALFGSAILWRYATSFSRKTPPSSSSRERIRADGNRLLASSLLHDLSTPLHVFEFCSRSLAENDSGAFRRDRYRSQMAQALERMRGMVERTRMHLRIWNGSWPGSAELGTLWELCSVILQQRCPNFESETGSRVGLNAEARPLSVPGDLALLSHQLVAAAESLLTALPADCQIELGAAPGEGDAVEALWLRWKGHPAPPALVDFVNRESEETGIRLQRDGDESRLHWPLDPSHGTQEKKDGTTQVDLGS